VTKSTKLFAIVLCAALFATILGEKLIFIDKYGSDLPFWDQWDAEGDNLYRPYVENRLTAKDFFSPHNEHRIFFTRVLGIALFELNDRQWDSRVEMLVNTVIHTALALLLLGFALRVLPLGSASAFALLTVVFFTTCVSFENTLAGFQSQLYLLLLFSALHIGGTLLARPRSLAWWCAPLAGVAALLSMGSGLLSAAAILVALAAQVLRERKLSRDDIWVLTTNLMLCAAGWLMKVEVSYHESLKAAGFLPWITAWLHQLSWPVKNIHMAALGLLPPVALTLAYFFRRINGPSALVLLAACAWAGLQTAAIAYARGAVENGFAPRYTDILSISILVNFLAVTYLATNTHLPSLKFTMNLTAAAFVCVSLWGLSREEVFIEQGTLRNLPEINNARIASVRNYVGSHDPSFFSKTPWTELPYPTAERLAGLLDVPAMRQILPSCVRLPLTINADPSATDGFDEYRSKGQLTPPPRPLAVWLTRQNEEKPTTHYFVSLPFPTEHSQVGIFVASGDPQCLAKPTLINGKGLKYEPLGKNISTGQKWKRINFSVPKGTYRLEITYEGNSWFAFTQPMTDTQLSHLALKAPRLGPWFLGLGLSLGFAALVLLVLQIKNDNNTLHTATA
jgi:hypothetical protein